MRNRSRHAVLGITLVEVMVTVLLGGLLMIALAALRARTGAMVEAQRESLVATSYLQDRLNQLRTLSWTDLTSRSTVQTFLADSTKQPASVSDGRKPVQIEEVEVSAWSLSNSSNSDFTTDLTAPLSSYKLVRTLGSAATASGSTAIDTLLLPVNSVAIKVTVKWPRGGDTMARSMSCLVTKYGMNRPKS